MGKRRKPGSGGAIPMDGDDRALTVQAAAFQSLPADLGAGGKACDPSAKPPPAKAMSLDPMNDRTLAFLQSWEPVDQGDDRSTCVAFSVLAMIEFHEYQQQDGKAAIADYSEEFLYHMMRTEHEPDVQPVNFDEGSTFMQQAVDALQASGVCLDATMPYRTGIEDPAYTEEPSQAAEDEAKTRIFAPESFVCERLYRNSVESWRDFDLVTTFRQALRNGSPISASFPIYKRDNQWSLRLSRGWMYGVVDDPEPVPRPHVVDVIKESGIETAIIGGHSVCIVGYLEGPDGSDGRFVFRNSWGNRFARQFDDDDLPVNAPRRGYGTISAAHVQNHCWEFMFQRPVFQGA